MQQSQVRASKGLNHFDGEAALIYARMRYVSGGDYSRTERQRKLISSLIESVKDASLTQIMSLINDVLPYVTTDMSNSEIISYATKGLGALADGGQMSSLRIPADDAHYSATINGMSVLVPDLGMCQEDLEVFFHGAE
jgi:anionic cell wall polymer biosynthesis LytR-Cps2A-Psr (LCP) family protein